VQPYEHLFSTLDITYSRNNGGGSGDSADFFTSFSNKDMKYTSVNYLKAECAREVKGGLPTSETREMKSVRNR